MFFGYFLSQRKYLARRGESRQTFRLKDYRNKRAEWGGNHPLPSSPFTGGGGFCGDA